MKGSNVKKLLSSHDQLSADEYLSLRGEKYNLCNIIASRLSLNSSHVVLDIGCGPGQNSNRFREITSAEVIGVDLDIKRVRHAKGLWKNISFMHADVAALPVEANSINAVTSMISFHRFINKQQALKEMGRVLKPNGKIAIATTTAEKLKRRVDFQMFPSALSFECNRFGSAEEIVKLLKISGYKNICIEDFSDYICNVDEGFMSWVKSKPFSIFRHISEKEFEMGLNKLQELILLTGSSLPHYDDYTLIFGEYDNG